MFNRKTSKAKLFCDKLQWGKVFCDKVTKSILTKVRCVNDKGKIDNFVICP